MRTFKFNEFNGKTKKKKKFRFGVFFRILATIVEISFLFSSPIFLFNRNIYLTPAESFFKKELKTTVLSLIHVETFEGGKTSRASFLEGLANKFNKENMGVYVTVKTISPEQLKINYNENFCDIISFGFGVGDIVKDELIELPKTDMREEFLESSKLNNKILVYPYMYGGYVAITREQTFNNFDYEKNDIKSLGNITIKQKNKKEYSLGFAKNVSINVAGALVDNDISTSKEIFFENNLSTYQMYENFLGNKFATLVGTTRDLIRCKDREDKGTISSLVYNYLGGYTDLVQYMGITSKSIEKQEIAKKFLSFVMNPQNQKELTKVGLFSCVEKKIYKEEYLKDFEKVLSNKLRLPSAFLSAKEIEDLKIESYKKVCYEI